MVSRPQQSRGGGTSAVIGLTICEKIAGKLKFHEGLAVIEAGLTKLG